MVDAKKVPNLKLSDGSQCPQLGLGTWKSKPGEVKQAVMDAIDAGYRHIDCAWIYGNETEIGEGIAEKIKDGTVKREDLYIVSKLWQTFHSTEGVRKGITKTLTNLNLPYIDLYLIHWPQAYKEGLDEKFPKDEKGNMLYDESIDYVNTWQDVERLIDEGLIKAAGLSNFNSYQIERILKVAQHKPVMNQVEAHIYTNQQKLAKFCADRGIAITAFCPLGSGDRPWAKAEDAKPLEDPVVKEIAKKRNMQTAQVLICFLLQLGYVVVPKSTNKERLAQNIQSVNYKLQKEDMDKLLTLNNGTRYCVNHWDAGNTRQYPLQPNPEGGVEF